ncbi:MAG: putative baseplate assembly protein [Acidobacteriota bacterium]|nr:putative baseplate assembly protein [Acidobacteriota bacterium]
MKYFCCDERRRNAVKSAPGAINGIEFLEVVDRPGDPPEVRQRTVKVYFIKPLAFGTLQINNVLIEGGERIRDIQVVKVTGGAVSSPPFDGPNVLAIEVEEAGDFSTYTLRLVRDAARAAGEDDTDSEFRKPPVGFDPILSAVDFSFKILCPSDFDCGQEQVCPPEQQVQPDINYLAKDYASFRQLMLDRMNTLIPDWRERNPADSGIALVELLAYVGDYLSYQQDAVATEAYLSTARRRTSVRRHARLVDYFVSDGRNARAWVYVRVREGVSNLPLRSVRLTGDGEHSGAEPKVFTKFLTRVAETPKALSINSTSYQKALAARPQIFEPLHDVKLFAEHNEMRFYTWGTRECCLPRGATSATLRGSFPNLRMGDVLILAEVRGPATGLPGDADSSHRHAVRLQKVTPSTDPIGGQFNVPPNNDSVSVTEIEWHEEDALPFPLCVSSRDGAEYYDDVSVALGNIVLADHGVTIEGEALPEVPGANKALTKVTNKSGGRCDAPPADLTPHRYRPQLRQSPLTHAATYATYDSTESAEAASAAIRPEAKKLLPAIRLAEKGVDKSWTPKRDLLGSNSGAREFVVETERDGTASLRFGDDRFGSRPAEGARLTATYRVGGGASGNISADTLAHIASNDPALVVNIVSIRNPLPARGGADAESIERIRQDAPSAFQGQERAVTIDDYAEVAQKRSGLDVQRAAATLRWTGSWHTVFLSVDRLGGKPVDAPFERSLRRRIERFRTAGHDLEVDAPRPVSLEIEMSVCVKRGYLASDVKRALLEIFGNRTLPDNRRGVFHPDNFSFGQPVLLSRLLAAAQGTPGVDSVDITKFQRQGVASNAALTSGKLELGRLEIARLDNDPNFPERGVFKLTMMGGGR